MEKQKKHDERKSKSVSEKDLLSKMMKLKNKYGVDVRDLLSDSRTYYSNGSRLSKSSRRRSSSSDRERSKRSDPKSSRKSGSSSMHNYSSSVHWLLIDVREWYRFLTCKFLWRVMNGSNYFYGFSGHSKSNHDSHRHHSRSRSASPISKRKRSRPGSPQPEKRLSPPKYSIPKRPVPDRVPRRAATSAM